jgi:nucleotide-binding universal stress UspA family protein
VPVLAAGDVGYGVVIDDPDLRDEAQVRLDAVVEGLRGRSAVAVSGELLDGDPALALAERSSDLDLLVVGSTGHGVFGRVLLGSVSHHLMCHSATPVLAVPPE